MMHLEVFSSALVTDHVVTILRKNLALLKNACIPNKEICDRDYRDESCWAEIAPISLFP